MKQLKSFIMTALKKKKRLNNASKMLQIS
jgi:hypothetical protein